ncbi:MAG: outer membrane lipoprotein carrier protein LolA [Candidatus Cryptobacteroides sp.]
MRRLYIIGALLFLPLFLSAQTQNPQEQELLRKIAETSSAMTSFSADFKQVREVSLLDEPAVSTGQMQYRNDGRILWRYITPSAYQIAFTPTEVRINKGTDSQVMGLDDNPFFGQLRTLLLGIMTGEQLTGDGKFQISIVRINPEIVVRMVPLQRQIKRMFSEMLISFSPENYVVSNVVMKETDGSSTTIIFSSVKVE